MCRAFCRALISLHNIPVVIFAARQTLEVTRILQDAGVCATNLILCTVRALIKAKNATDCILCFAPCSLRLRIGVFTPKGVLVSDPFASGMDAYRAHLRRASTATPHISTLESPKYALCASFLGGFRLFIELILCRCRAQNGIRGVLGLNPCRMLSSTALRMSMLEGGKPGGARW